MNQPTPREFFVINSPLGADAPSYVERAADTELLKLLRAGKFAYVLTSRQMGKTSLTNRIALRLQQEGMRTVIVDLTGSGEAAVEVWYQGLVTELSDQLELTVDIERWWHERTLPPVQRFITFLRDVVLPESQTQIVIFIDEIDTTLKLPFSDDFFAAIRAIHNMRDRVKSFQRLSFVLLGVASPTDLIKDKNRTPFNIAEGVMLYDFDLGELGKLQAGLEEVLPAQGARIFARIYHWTDGHPYLTQKLCRLVWEAAKTTWRDEQIDELVRVNFLTETARGDSNLRDVQDRIIKHPSRRQLLELYRKVLKGRKVADDAHSITQNQLKLLGLIKKEDGSLVVRNPIYERVFDLPWVRTYTKINWARVAAVVSTIVALLAVGIITFDYWVGTEKAKAVDTFFSNASPAKRLDSLAYIFQLRTILAANDYDNIAREMFFTLERDHQLGLFDPYLAQVQPDDLLTVIKGLYINLTDVDGTGSTTPLLEQMAKALKSANETDQHLSTWQSRQYNIERLILWRDVVTNRRQLKEEIEHWLAGRTAVQQGRREYESALVAYDQAVVLNGDNPATLYERARVLSNLGRYREALIDLNQVIGIARQAPTPTPTNTPINTPQPTATVPASVTPTLTPQQARTAAPTRPLTSVPVVVEAFTPTPMLTPTPTPRTISSAFLNTSQRVDAVRELLTQQVGLARQLYENAEQYQNLVDFGLIPTATNTPIATQSPTATLTPTATRLQIATFGPQVGVINNGPAIIGNQVTFTAVVASGPQELTFYWEFGDGATDEGHVVQHSYTQAGTFKATLIASNGVNSSQAETYVVITEPSIGSSLAVSIEGLTATSNSPTTAGNPVNFVATILQGTNVTYNWDFGDGASQSSGSSISHIYKLPGDYAVEVQASNSVNTVKYNFMALIFEAPPRGLTIEVSSTRSINTPTTFTAALESGTNIQFEWVISDGTIWPDPNTNSLRTMSTYTHVFRDARPYTITVFASNSAGKISNSITAIVQDQLPTIISITNNGPLPSTTPMDFIAFVRSDSSITGEWLWGDNSSLSAIPTNETANLPVKEFRTSHRYAVDGKYIVTFVVRNTGGSVSNKIIAYAQTHPLAIERSIQISYEPRLLVVGESVTYSVPLDRQQHICIWDFGDGTISPESDTIIRHIYQQSKAYVVSVHCNGRTGSPEYYDDMIVQINNN